MANVALHISLDNPDRTYAAGEKITGVVEVRTDEAVACNGLRVAAAWRTRGHGNEAKGDGAAVELFRGTWEAGDALSYEFALDAPPGPASHAGTVLSVEWVVCATADVPWAGSPKAEQSFRLVAGGVEPYLGPAFTPPEAPAKESWVVVGCVVLVGLAFLVPGAVLVATGIGRIMDGYVAEGCACLLGLLLVAAGALLMYFGVRNMLAQRTLGRVEVRIEPQQVRRGQTLGVRVSLDPRRAAKVNGLKLELTGQEEATLGGGKSRHTKTHKFFEQAVTLLEGQTLEPGRPMRLDATFEIPADAPPTFAAPSNEVKWSLDVHFDLPGRPDWNTTYPVVVRP